MTVEKTIISIIWIIVWSIIGKMIHDNSEKAGYNPWFGAISISGLFGGLTLLVIWIA